MGFRGLAFLLCAVVGGAFAPGARGADAAEIEIRFGRGTGLAPQERTTLTCARGSAACRYEVRASEQVRRSLTIPRADVDRMIAKWVAPGRESLKRAARADVRQGTASDWSVAVPGFRAAGALPLERPKDPKTRDDLQRVNIVESALMDLADRASGKRGG